jgi:hypothetical protein
MNALRETIPLADEPVDDDASARRSNRSLVRSFGDRGEDNG